MTVPAPAQAEALPSEAPPSIPHWSRLPRNWAFPTRAFNRLRLVSGLVLFAYVTTHLINTAAGIVSIEAMGEGREIFLAVWRSIPGTLVLYGAATTHMALALIALYRRRHWRMPLAEWAQILCGFAIPYLLVEHVIGNRIAVELYQLNDNYQYVLWSLFVSPIYALEQALVVVLAWLHGCIGLHYWLRLKGWYRRRRLIAFGFALLLPTVALIGFYQGGREIMRLKQNPVAFGEAVEMMNLPDQNGVDRLYRIIDIANTTFFSIIGALLGVHLVRALAASRRGLVRVRYPGGRVVTMVRGPSVLEASRWGRVPHASVCGGRGRCTTCRVRICRGGEHLPPPDSGEAAALARLGVGSDVRLACQIRPVQNLEVLPLLPPGIGPKGAGVSGMAMFGQEMEIAVLFADLRGFTTLSESRLPYDVVFLLNRYFAEMGLAIEAAGGRVDKFIGDGIMALFGLGMVEEGREGAVGPHAGARGAVAAARQMVARLEALNADLAEDLPEPLRIGIGIHAGPSIVGEMGYGPAITLTAIGDTVNTASRLEQMTKGYKAELVISAEAASLAGLDISHLPRETITPRGRAHPLDVHIAAKIADLDKVPDQK